MNYSYIIIISFQVPYPRVPFRRRENQRCQPRLSTLLSTLHTKYLTHTFCMGIFVNSEGSHTKYMGLGSLIHFVWGFLSYILYGDFVNSWSSEGTISTPLIFPTPLVQYWYTVYLAWPGHLATDTNNLSTYLFTKVINKNTEIF